MLVVETICADPTRVLRPGQDDQGDRARPEGVAEHSPQGTGKTHRAIEIVRSCVRGGARARFYNVVDLVNRLEAEARAGRQGRIADHLARFDLVVLDELGYLPFAQSGGQLLFHLISRLYEQTSIVVTPISPSASGPASSATRR